MVAAVDAAKVVDGVMVLLLGRCECYELGEDDGCSFDLILVKPERVRLAL